VNLRLNFLKPVRYHIHRVIPSTDLELVTINYLVFTIKFISVLCENFNIVWTIILEGRVKGTIAPLKSQVYVCSREDNCITTQVSTKYF